MKTKIPRFYIIILLVSIILFVMLEWAKPREISWETSFSSYDKMPYGTFVLAQMLPQMFPDKNMSTNTINYYDFLNEESKASIIIINSNFDIDEYSVGGLLNFVEQGGQVFISALNFEQLFLDTLGIDIEYFSVINSNKLEFNYIDERLKNDSNYHIKYMYGNYFNVDSCENYKAIGNLVNGRYNFIKIQIGDGFLLLNSNPLAFTNYNILSGNTIDYVEKAFSQMEIRDIIWDEYFEQNTNQNKSIFQYIANNPSLKVAYYISTILLILFMVFYGKRRQKLIPIVLPLRNSSLDFVDTISKLYLQQQKNNDIADKLILYFLKHVYLHYKIKTHELNEEFIKKLSLRTGNSKDEVRALIMIIQVYRKTSKISRDELMKLNKKIEIYYQS